MTLAAKRSRAAGAAAPLGKLYDLAGERLWLHRSGEGRPAAVFLSGAGTVGLDYFNVQQEGAQLTTSVIYDRAGTGWSDAAPMRRSAAATVGELRGLLSLAGIAPPYVLVGHSLGGLFARRYTQLHPSEVAGLVLLDPAHEDYDAYMPERLKALRKSGSGWVRLMLGGLSGAALGAAIRIAPGLIERAPDDRRYRELYRRLFSAEMCEWPASLREARVSR